MPGIEILGSGRIDEHESAFPQAVQLPNGVIICSFSVGGGQSATGGTDWARSTDGGESWTLEGTVLPTTTDPQTSNSLKLSLSPDGGTVYAYGSRSYVNPSGTSRREAVLCRSTNGGRTWSAPQAIPMPTDRTFGVSHGILPLSSGRLLAPAVLHGPGRLAERAVAAISHDDGETWPSHTVVFEDPDKTYGYLELKLAELEPGRLIATCWTTTLADSVDQENSFAISDDDGSSWAAPASTGIMGQTMTPVPLDDGRLLVVYNRRYGEQAIMAALVTFTARTWTVHHERVMYDPRTSRDPESSETGLDEWAQFEFGFPTAIRLRDGAILATHWSKEAGKFGVRWTRMRVDF